MSIHTYDPVRVPDPTAQVAFIVLGDVARQRFVLQEGTARLYDLRDHLKSNGWRWDSRSKVWWTADRNVVRQLKTWEDFRIALSPTVMDVVRMLSRRDALISAARANNIATAWPPVVPHEEGFLVLGGIWSEDQRTYSYCTLQVGGYWPDDLATTKVSGPNGLITRVAAARGERVEEWRPEADTNFDGDGYHDSGKASRVTLWWVSDKVPVRVKYGTTYRSSGKIHYGSSSVHFYGGPTTGPGYKAASRRFRAAHGLPEPARLEQKRVTVGLER